MKICEDFRLEIQDYIFKNIIGGRPQGLSDDRPP